MENSSIRGTHPVVVKIVAAAERIAATDVGVLIVGEKGTGKELLARFVHDMSSRANGPFLRVDCQDLAGHWDGTIVTGALSRELEDDGIGADILQRARGGTLFLDHISAFGPDLQARLLTSIVGGSVATVDVRLVAAREPTESLPSCLAVAALALVEIPVPALRHRRSDIPVLVEHFLDLYSVRHGVGPCRIERDAMVQLWQYDWPGNIRELETAIERVVVLSRCGVIRVSDLPPHIGGGNGKGKPRGTPSGTPPTLDPLPPELG